MSLRPSLAEFEDELLQQLNQDRAVTELSAAAATDSPQLQIEKRYLQVLARHQYHCDQAGKDLMR